MKNYKSLFKLYRGQPLDSAFAHFYPIDSDFDKTFCLVADNTMDGFDSWGFNQPRFKQKHSYSAVPKLKNYLNYTFVRLVELENLFPGKYFFYSEDQDWICFNTGLQNSFGSDLVAIFQRNKPRENPSSTLAAGPKQDWVFKACHAPNDSQYRTKFGASVPELASYCKDSRDYVFDTSYNLDKDVFDHLFDRAKDRAGLPNAPDEVVRNYLRGAIENLIPKIKRNYKVAIPVYYVEEKRMQLLLPFFSASNANDISCFLVERDDSTRCYRLKTIFDLDQAYFSARLITRPDREWLNP
jgi:hypothetical protein